MAGLNGAGSNIAYVSGSRLSRQQFAAITWLRWRMFLNTLRGKGAVGELIIKIFSYPILALMIFGPATGATFAAYYFVHQDMDAWLALPLWLIFLLWQFLGASTSTTGPSFDLSALVRFPLQYRDYLLMRLSFGLMDPPTLAGVMCLVGMSIGVAIANLRLAPWAALALMTYAACNVLFSRMIYTWLERWLATRKTRELVTGAILFLSLGIQVASQFFQRIAGHHAPLSPWVLNTAHIVITINWFLPPGLTAAAIEHMHHGAPLIATAAYAGLLACTIAFLAVLHVRLHAQYLGENLSEAPAKARKAARKDTRIAAAKTASASRKSLLSPAIAAGLVKEIRYLLRSGPKLYMLVMPVFVVFLFSMRNSGFSYMGLSRGGLKGLLFCYGCAYMQLIFVAMVYNSLGSDGSGVQFYFLAPLRMRDVMLAKNMLTGAIMAMEIVLIYTVAAFISGPPPAGLTAATIAWSLFTLLLNMSIGNVRSITSPKAMDSSRMRSQNVSGVSSFISLAVVLSAIALGALMIVLSNTMHVSLWIAALVFLALSAFSLTAYLLVLKRIQSIALDHVEDLTRTLSKAA